MVGHNSALFVVVPKGGNFHVGHIS